MGTLLVLGSMFNSKEKNNLAKLTNYFRPGVSFFHATVWILDWLVYLSSVNLRTRLAPVELWYANNSGAGVTFRTLLFSCFCPSYGVVSCSCFCSYCCVASGLLALISSPLDSDYVSIPTSKTPPKSFNEFTSDPATIPATISAFINYFYHEAGGQGT